MKKVEWTVFFFWVGLLEKQGTLFICCAVQIKQGCVDFVLPSL